MLFMLSSFANDDDDDNDAEIEDIDVGADANDGVADDDN